MSDNITLSAAIGAGAVLATDDISSVHHQLVKMEFGTDGAATMVSSSNPLPVALSSSGGLTSLALLDDVVGTDGSTCPTKGNTIGGIDGSGNFRRALMDCSGRQVVNVNSMPSMTVGSALPAGSNNIGDVDVLSIAAGDNKIGRMTICNSDNSRMAYIDSNSRLEVSATMNGTNYIYPLPTGVSGLSISRVVAAGNTNPTVAKASAGNLYGYEIYNDAAAIRFVKFHNTASAPTAGTGVVYTIMIPADTFVRHYFNHGIYFSSGIAYTTVQLAVDSDNTAVVANDLIVQVL